MGEHMLRKIIFEMIVSAKKTPGVNIKPKPLARGLHLAARYDGQTESYQLAAWVSGDPKRPGLNELAVIAAESPGWLNFGQWESRQAEGEQQVYQIVVCSEKRPKSEVD